MDIKLFVITAYFKDFRSIFKISKITRVDTSGDIL